MLRALIKCNIVLKERMKGDLLPIRFSFKHLPTAEVEPQWKSAHAPCDVVGVPDEYQGRFNKTLFKTVTAQPCSAIHAQL